MARGKYFTDDERLSIRVGVHLGLDCPTIAKAIGRTKQGVWEQKRQMRVAGTLDDLPMQFLLDAIAEKLNGK